MRRADVRLVRAAFALVATGVIWLAAAPAPAMACITAAPPPSMVRKLRLG